MASDGQVSGLQWDHMDIPESITGSSGQNSVRKWLTTTVTEEDAKHEPPKEAAEPLRRNPSSDDDLALGVEASLYGKQGVRTVQEFLRWSRSSPALTRWNSISSAASVHSGPLSVMDILNLWNDDPEEFLLDLGFGCDEPDLSGRIPARFINHQSQARGINLQVFLEAQKSRLDLENPDVSSRFRQLEVLQQVTTAFSSLVGSSPVKAQLDKDLPPEARERRRRMGMLFRRASKKSLSQIHNQKAQDLRSTDVPFSPCAAPESLQTPPGLADKKVPLKRLKPGHLETVSLSPLAEELGAGPDPQSQSHMLSYLAQEGALRPGAMREGHPLTAMSIFQRKKSPCQAKESFEMEEIHSFDEGSVTGSYTGAENIVRGLIRTNSCQSDSSGFLEEPYVPSLPQQGLPGPDLIKALSGLSGESTDSHSSERPGSPSASYPHTPTSPLLSSCLISSGVDESSSPCPSPEPSSGFALPKSDLHSSEIETPSNQDQSSSSLLQSQTQSQSPPLASLTSFTSLSPSSTPSLIEGSEEVKPDNKNAPRPNLSTLPHDSVGTACSTSSNVAPTLSSPSPDQNLDCSFSASIAMSSESSSGSSENTQSGSTEQALNIKPHSASGGSSSLLHSSLHLPPSVSNPDFYSPSSLVSPPSTESLTHSPKYNKTTKQNDSIFSNSDELDLSGTPTKTSCPLSSQLDKDKPSAPSLLILTSSKLEEGSPALPCLSPNLSTPVSQSAFTYDPDGLIDPSVQRLSHQTEQSLLPNTDHAPASPVQDVIHDKKDGLSLHLEDTLQRNEKGEGEGARHMDTEQTQDSFVYIPDTESSEGLSERSRLVSEEVCNQRETDSQVSPCTLQVELSDETKQEELRKVCQVEMKDTESESPRSYLVLHDEVAVESSQTDADLKELIEIESLDMVFETSVDGSDVESGEADAFLQQLHTEGQVFWAEPIEISTSPQLLEEADDSPENPDLPKEPADSFSSTGKEMPLDEKLLSSSASRGIDQISKNVTASSDTLSPVALDPCSLPPSTSDLKSLSRSVSVQMSSSPSSHIIQRRDVPYMTASKRTLPPSTLPLDTSTPFRAVQSWTDLQIQRTKTLSQEILDTVPVEVTLSTSAPDKMQSNWQSHDSLPGMAKNYRTVSVSVDTGLCPYKERGVDGNENEAEKRFWEDNQTTTMVCCCSCDHRGTCSSQKSYNRQQTVENIPYSLDELEEMMLCLQQFCSVLSNMEEQLSEDQAAVYSALTDQDREKVRDIEELRRAVKHEAGELEKQLNELAHHYDDSLKMSLSTWTIEHHTQQDSSYSVLSDAP
ncbi:serine-rich adhesin for platelets isoform X2 [Anabas testudineus]|uniref:serine-rich adhesin for platelets isoform X2 n=1 Tax=Anabas testudineus TaxID=64144 RepID=UPI000E463266|nr:serine-rich adhesin for platelets isoform X2 [Anabas testudineus]